MLEHLTEWLEKTQIHALFSDTNHVATWLIIPISQTLHIISVSFLMIAVVLLNLRLLGLAGKSRTFAELATSLIPWIWGALAVLLTTGIIQTIAEPSRELMNTGFRIKMLLLLITVAITAVYQVTVARDPSYWELSPQRKASARMLAGTSLGMWFVIAALGRLIAYWA